MILTKICALEALLTDRNSSVAERRGIILFIIKLIYFPFEWIRASGRYWVEN